MAKDLELVDWYTSLFAGEESIGMTWKDACDAYYKARQEITKLTEKMHKYKEETD